MRLLIAIPVHNEKKYLNSVLDKVLSYHPDVLVVDDGSTDGTTDLLTQRLAGRRDIQLLRHPVNLGYGQSIIDAFRYADTHGYEWVVTMDCDEQHEPEMIPAFVEHARMNRWDMISGSRYMAPRKDDDLPPNDRRMINFTLTATLNELFGWRLTDSFCGFKAHRVSAMRRLELDERGYAFPLQLWPQCAAHDIRIHEIPVRLIYNDPNRSFGTLLDDAANRLTHYLDVLKRELRKIGRDADALRPVAVAAGLPVRGDLSSASGATGGSPACVFDAQSTGGQAAGGTKGAPERGPVDESPCPCCCPE